MITPSAIEILDIVENALATSVRPEVRSEDALSTLATVGHLLRHVRQRVLHEGEILTQDVARLRALLPDVADWLEGADRAAAEQVRAALAAAPRPAGGYADLVSLGAEARELRRALNDSLSRLVDLRAEHGGSPGYEPLRSRIRQYLADQISAEKILVDPAFEGRGPRR